MQWSVNLMWFGLCWFIQTNVYIYIYFYTSGVNQHNPNQIGITDRLSGCAHPRDIYRHLVFTYFGDAG